MNDPERARLEGELGGGRLLDALEAISATGRTGILTAHSSEEIIAISFDEGRIVAADALNRTLEEGLRELLVDQGRVRSEDFAGLAAEHQAGGGRVLDLLVEREYLARADLLEEVRTLVGRLVTEALRWGEGDFKFYAGEEVVAEEGLRPLTVEEAVVAAAEALDEEEGGRLPPPPGPQSVFRRSPSAPEDPAAASLSEKAVLELIDGRRSVGDLLELSGLGRQRLVYLLLRLEVAGQVVREPGGAAAPEVDEGVSGFDLARLPGELGRRLREPGRRRHWAGAGAMVGLWLRRRATALPALVAAAGAVWLVLLLVGDPASLLYLFPWDRPERDEMLAVERQNLVDRVDRAATVHHLLVGRYPASTDELVAAALVDARDLVSGRARLEISGGRISYALRWRVPGEEGPPAKTGVVTTNFLLDPEIEATPGLGGGPPLVLLD